MIVNRLREVVKIPLLHAALVILLATHLRLIAVLEEKVSLRMETLVHFQDLVFQSMILSIKNGQLLNGMNYKISI